MERAACAGKAPNKRKDPEALDLWFPEKTESHNPGKVVCFSGCPVRTECEEYRQKTESKFGIWAGQLRGDEA